MINLSFCLRSLYEFHEFNICRNQKILEKEFLRRQEKLTQQEKDLALMSAALTGNIDGVRLLIDNGANVQAVDGNYDDAMSLAAANNHTEVIRVLLDCGALPNEPNVHHYTPLVHACEQENMDLVKLLLRHVNFKGCDKSIIPRCDDANPGIPAVCHYSNKLKPFPWHTPLMTAVRVKNVELVKILLEANIPLNEADFRGNTAVHHAVWDYEPVIMDLLLEANADVNVEDLRGHTPLSVASIFKRKDEIMLKLIRHSAEVKWERKIGMGLGSSMLYEVAAYGSSEIIEALCEAGAPLDLAYSGRTPLINAIDYNNREAVKVLIQYGCSLDAVSQLPVREIREKVKGPHYNFIPGAPNLEMIKLLHGVGAFTGENLHKCLMDEKLRDAGSDNTEFCELLEQLASNPLKLSLVCRKVVRDVIQKPLQRTVPQLGMPPTICDFLLYSDI